MYLQGGYNVYPVEVENVLGQHPDVVQAAGIGIPDDVLGAVGRYFVQRRPGTTVTDDDLRAWCAERLANYKVPREIVFVDEFPLTPAGKVHKAVLPRG
jgi:fatty-acyl-CoA synthase